MKDKSLTERYKYNTRRILAETNLYATGRWIKAKFPSICSCGNHINLGDECWYIPYQHKVKCETCEKRNYPSELKTLLKER